MKFNRRTFKLVIFGFGTSMIFIFPFNNCHVDDNIVKKKLISTKFILLFSKISDKLFSYIVKFSRLNPKFCQINHRTFKNSRKKKCRKRFLVFDTSGPFPVDEDDFSFEIS